MAAVAWFVASVINDIADEARNEGDSYLFDDKITLNIERIRDKHIQILAKFYPAPVVEE